VPGPGKLLLLSAGLLLLSACKPPEQKAWQQQLLAFGTLIDISLYGVEQAQAGAAIQAVDEMYQRQHRDWHAWQQGHLTDLNNAIATGRSMQAESSILELILLGQQFERRSKGLFNPAVGALLELWGFQQDEPDHNSPPSQVAIREWLNSAPSSLQLDIEGKTVSSRNPAVRLDLGGFAKGYSVGKAIELLEQRAIHNLVVNAGGDLCVRGKHGQRPWRIGIRDPRMPGILASIELEGSICAFTSGDYERYIEYQGRRFHHILDPRTGYPAMGTASVTVLADDPALADAAATALFVAGPQQWTAIAIAMGITDVLLIDDRDHAWITPGLQERLHFEREPASITVVDL
jgi:thiamine biosynthesis lipoprotein